MTCCPSSGPYLSVPDQDGFCFTQAYQSIGLGLSSAVGAAIARPDRLTVAALGDGSALMGISELETVVRLGLPMLIVIYDDEAYGAKVHHFGPAGHPLRTVRFRPAGLAAIARGFGCEGVTVRSPGDLDPVRSWLAGPMDRPPGIEGKVTSAQGAGVAAEAGPPPPRPEPGAARGGWSAGSPGAISGGLQSVSARRRAPCRDDGVPARQGSRRSPARPLAPPSGRRPRP